MTHSYSPRHPHHGRHPHRSHQSDLRSLEREEDERHSYHDPSLGLKVVSIVVGECSVSDQPDVVITTTLGSCVAACLFDPERAIGGMNHFLLADPVGDQLSASARYGSAAMEQLINRMLTITRRRDRLRAKIFGGANTLSQTNSIGARNVEFVMEYLANEGIPTISWDVGGEQGRAVRFFPTSGRSQRRLIGGGGFNSILKSENRFAETLRKSKIEGDIELF
ncbi:chemotaxis protein CheD [Azospirillaceae bacterium]